MVQWMDAVDNSIKNLLKDLATAEEFEREKAIFQVKEILHVWFFTNHKEWAKLEI